MTLHVDGDGPLLLAELAAVMPAAPALVDRLVTEFAPTAATMATPQAYWVGFNGWLTDRLSGPITQGTVAVAVAVGEQAWAILASSYWGGLELREHWGMPPVIERLGIALSPPFAEVEQGIVAQMAQRLAALRGGGERCLEILPSILREDAPSGPIHGIAYNAGVQVVKAEDPPIGQRRPQRTPRPSAVRINARHFLRVDYDLPTPDYLKVWRSAFERAVTANPDTYFDETIRWSSILTFGLEAAGLAAFVALINQDPAAATVAVLCNALYLGATPGWLIGLLDTGATLPRVVEAQGASTHDE